jgi:stress-induced-phosphoprotein 1
VPYQIRVWHTDVLDAVIKCIKLNQSWSKGYARKGAALHGAKRFDEAIEAYEAGLTLEDSPALRKGLQEVKDAKGKSPSPTRMKTVVDVLLNPERDVSEPLGLGKMFADPNLIGKLATNPRTQKHLADPAFMQKVDHPLTSRPTQLNDLLSSNSSNKTPHLLVRTSSLSISVPWQHSTIPYRALQSDPRMIDVLGVAMGIDMQGFSPDDGFDGLPPGYTPPSPRARPPRSPSASTSKTPPAPAPAPAPPAPEPEDVEMTDEDAEEAKAKADALAAKAQGAEHYKAQRFSEAAEYFKKAWDLWPKDITFLGNLGAAYLEAKEYDQCIATCELAVEEGRGVGRSLPCTRSLLTQVSATRRLQDHCQDFWPYRDCVHRKERPSVREEVLPKVTF